MRPYVISDSFYQISTIYFIENNQIQKHFSFFDAIIADFWPFYDFVKIVGIKSKNNNKRVHFSIVFNSTGINLVVNYINFFTYSFVATLYALFKISILHKLSSSSMNATHSPLLCRAPYILLYITPLFDLFVIISILGSSFCNFRRIDRVLSIELWLTLQGVIFFSSLYIEIIMDYFWI